MKSLIIILEFLIISSSISQWQQINSGISGTIVRGITSNGQYLFSASDGYGVYRSTNQGNNWVMVNSGITNNSLWALREISGILFAGSFSPNSVSRSSNNGDNWTNLGLSSIRNFISHNNHIYAVDWSSGVYRSTNSGNSWIPVNSGISGGGFWPIISANGILYVGGASGVFKSTNNGDNWVNSNSGLIAGNVYSLAELSGDIFAGTLYGGVYRSTNSGNNWSVSNTGMGNLTVYALYKTGSILAAGTSTNGVYFSYDNGSTWSFSNQGLTSTNVTELYSDNNYIYAGTLGGGICRRPLTEVMSVVPVSNEVPENFSLSQNYPNPFNPVTNIGLKIKESGFVSLVVFDAAGRQAAILINEVLKAGIYNVDFNAADLPSGIYFYFLKAGGFKETKKMILVK